MNWILLGIAAYCIGQIIFIMDIKARHPGRPLIQRVLVAFAWPYLAIRRSIAPRRSERMSQW